MSARRVALCLGARVAIGDRLHPRDAANQDVIFRARPFALITLVVLALACDPCKRCPATCQSKVVHVERSCSTIYVDVGAGKQTILAPIESCTEAHDEMERSCR